MERPFGDLAIPRTGVVGEASLYMSSARSVTTWCRKKTTLASDQYCEACVNNRRDGALAKCIEISVLPNPFLF